MKHSQAHLFTYCLVVFKLQRQSWIVVTERPSIPWSLNYLFFSPLQKKFAVWHELLTAEMVHRWRRGLSPTCLFFSVDFSVKHINAWLLWNPCHGADIFINALYELTLVKDSQNVKAERTHGYYLSSPHGYYLICHLFQINSQSCRPIHMGCDRAIPWFPFQSTLILLEWGANTIFIGSSFLFLFLLLLFLFLVSKDCHFLHDYFSNYKSNTCLL